TKAKPYHGGHRGKARTRRQAEVRNQKSGVRSQKIKRKSQQPKAKSQRPMAFLGVLCGFKSRRSELVILVSAVIEFAENGSEARSTSGPRRSPADGTTRLGK